MDIDPQTDLLIRTIYGEAGNQPLEGQQAIAATVYNRAKTSGKPITTELLAPNQYQAWQNPTLKAKMNALSASSPEYQTILANIQPVLSGHVSLPYTKYLNRSSTPAGSTALTTWAKDPGTPIGDHEFYGPEDAEDPDIAAALGQAVGEAAHPGVSDEDFAAALGQSTSEPTGPDPGVIDPRTHIRMGTAAQQEAMRRDQALGDVTTDTEGVSHFKGSPMFVVSSADDVERIPDGSYYYSPQGKLQYKGEKKTDVPRGLLEGANDVALSIGKMLPGTKDSEVRQRLQNYQGQYDAAYRGNTLNDLGRFAGQTAAITPALSGVGALASRAVPAVAAPVMDFFGGRAAGNAFVQGSSLAANGALQGAGTGALMSSTSDRPFWEQVGEGAVTGAIANPIIHGIGSKLTDAASPLVSTKIAELADKAVNRFGLNLRPQQIQSAIDSATGAPTNVHALGNDARLAATAGSRTAKNIALQGPAGTRAIGSTFGVAPEEMKNGLTPEVMQAARTRIGTELNNYADGRTITGGNLESLLSSISEIPSDAKRSGVSAESVNALWDNINHIKNMVKRSGGSLTGDQYKTFIANGSPFDNLQSSSDSTARYYASKIKDALDDALESPVDSNVPDDHWRALKDSLDLENFKKARLQYKNMMTVKPLAEKYSATGIIPLHELSGVVNRNFRNKAFAGAGELGDLADIGELFANPSAATGKVPVSWGKIGLLAGGTGAGGAGALFTHSPQLALGTAALAAGGVGANAAKHWADDFLNTRTSLSNRLIQNSLNPSRPTVTDNPLTQFLADRVAIPATTIPVENAFQQQQRGR